MQRRAFLGLCGAGLAGLLGTPLRTWAADGVIKMGVTDTIFPGLNGAQLTAATLPIRTLLESATGRGGRISLGGTPRALADKIKKDRVQMGVFQGVEFAWARASNPRLLPIVLCVTEERTLRAYLIVRASSKAQEPADLRGTTLALPAETRAHCSAFLRCKCLPDDAPMKSFFKKVVKATDVEEALDDVVNGNVEAALVDGLPWQTYRKTKPGCARKLRVLRASGEFPCAIIACQQGRYSDAQVKRFRSDLVSVGSTIRGKALLRLLTLTGFEAPPADYDRLIRATAQDYPPQGQAPVASR